MHRAVKTSILAADAAPTRAWSGFAAGFRNEQLPAQRVARAAQRFLDRLACALSMTK